MGDFTWDDAPGSQLPSRRESIDFTAARRITEVRAVYDEEYAYRTVDGEGSFQAGFTGSTISGDGKTVALRRSGGWNRKVRVYPEIEQGGGALAQLQDLNGAYAAWSLAEAASASTRVDRTGNGRYAQGGGVMRIPAPVHGERAFAIDGSQNMGPAYVMQTFMPAAHFQVTGFSFAWWFCWLGYAPQYTPDAWVLSWCSDSAAWIPWYYDIGAFANPGGTVRYWDGASTATVTSLRHGTSLGLWEFCQVSWDPDGTLIMGIDDAYETFVGIQGHAPPPQYPFGILGPTFGSTFRRYANGGASDLVVWDRALSIDEFRAQRASTGVPLP